MHLEEYLKKFEKEFKKATDEEIKEFDEEYLDFENELIKEIKTEIGEISEEKERELRDLLYMLFFVKKEYDARYDNVLISEALEKAGIKY